MTADAAPDAADAAAEPMLSIRDLHAYYGKSHVLQGVDLEVRGGEVVALLGRNGVGRSTLAKAVMGVVAPVGAIDFRGQPIAGLPKHRIARLGLGYIPEDRAIFNGLTVRENLGLGLKNPRRPARYDVDQMLDMFPNLRARADTDAAVLSGGEKQMLAMCRTLIGDPALIIIDEPTEGLAPKIVQQIGDMIAEIARLGVSILLIEQKLSIALRIARRVYVMGHGEIVYEGTPARFAERDDVRREWLEV